MRKLLILIAPVLIGALVLSGCDEAAGLHNAKVTLSPPAWLQGEWTTQGVHEGTNYAWLSVTSSNIRLSNAVGTDADFAAIGESERVSISESQVSDTHYRVRMVEGSSVVNHNFRRVDNQAVESSTGSFVEYSFVVDGGGRRLYLRRR